MSACRSAWVASGVGAASWAARAVASARRESVPSWPIAVRRKPPRLGQLRLLFCPLLLVLRAITLHQQEAGQREHAQRRYPHHRAADERAAPACADVTDLKLGRLLAVFGPPGQPALSGLEVVASQQEAAVALLAIPFHRARDQARVNLEPRQVGLERLDQLLERRVLVILVACQDPVRRVQLGIELLRLDVGAQDRDEPLVVLDRVADLLATDLRGGERRREDHDHRLGGLYPLFDPCVPVGALGNVVQVDPDVLAARLERAHQGLHELTVVARVGDERVRTLGLRRCGSGRRHRRATLRLRPDRVKAGSRAPQQRDHRGLHRPGREGHHHIRPVTLEKARRPARAA